MKSSRNIWKVRMKRFRITKAATKKLLVQDMPKLEN